MQWFTRVASWASVINVLVASLDLLAGGHGGSCRTALMTAIAVLALINVLGIRQSAWVVNALTIGKLVPLAIFIAFAPGRRSVTPAAAICPRSPTSRGRAAAIFAFGG
jgi:amino acid transporter